MLPPKLDLVTLTATLYAIFRSWQPLVQVPPRWLQGEFAAIRSIMWDSLADLAAAAIVYASCTPVIVQADAHSPSDRRWNSRRRFSPRQLAYAARPRAQGRGGVADAVPRVGLQRTSSLPRPLHRRPCPSLPSPEVLRDNRQMVLPPAERPGDNTLSARYSSWTRSEATASAGRPT